MKQQFFNRGLFLLTVGHVLIALAETHDHIDFIHKLKGSTIIDEIGLATLLASCFIDEIRDVPWARGAAVGGTVLFAACWLLNWLWFPASAALWLRHDGNRWMSFGIVLPRRSALSRR